MSRRTILIIILAVLVLVPAVLILTGVLRPSSSSVRNVSLTWWTTRQDAEALKAVVALYRQSHPYVRVTVETKDPTTFDDDVKEAWAKDEGPDLVALPNDAVAAYQDFLAPAPTEVRVAVYRRRSFLGRENIEITQRTEAGVTPRAVRSNFADSVDNDVVISAPAGERVYGLPLSLDTLVLFVNRDLLSSAGVAAPATTWQQLVDQIPRLTLLDDEDGIVRPAVGIGLASNVPYAADLLTLLMLQNGTRMTDATGRDVAFHLATADGQTPGVGALTFYTDFAQSTPPKKTLTWSAAQPDALELFIQGRLAYAFGYQRDRARIVGQAPNLNLLVAPVPHLYDNGRDNDATAPAGDQQRTITYGRYDVQAVAKRAGADANQAWHLVQFAATNATAVRDYTERTQLPAALRSALAEQQRSPDLDVSATQAISARSWYHGTAADDVQAHFEAAIEEVATKGVGAATALERAANLIQLTLPEKP